MTDDRPEVLLAGLDDPTALRVVRVLEPLGVRFQRAPWWSAVAGVITGSRFEVVVVDLPREADTLASMIREVRASTSRSRQAALVVVCGRDRLDEAAPLVGRGANRVVATDRIDDELGGVVVGLLEIAPRFRVRCAIRVAAVTADGSPGPVECEVENISTSGMLIVGPLQAPPGAALDFELEEEDGSVRGRLQVVWTSPVGVGPERRIGARFDELAPDDRWRLGRLLSRMSN